MNDQVVVGPGVHDEPGSLDLFATNISSFFVHAGTVFITLETVRLVEGQDKAKRAFRREVVGRLVMPMSGAQNMVDGLGEFLKRQNQPPPRGRPHIVK